MILCSMDFSYISLFQQTRGPAASQRDISTASPNPTLTPTNVCPCFRSESSTSTTQVCVRPSAMSDTLTMLVQQGNTIVVSLFIRCLHIMLVRLMSILYLVLRLYMSIDLIQFPVATPRLAEVQAPSSQNNTEI